MLLQPYLLTSHDDTTRQGMSPSVTPTDTSALPESPSTEEPTGGCQGGRSPSDLLMVLLSVGLLMIARRRDGTLTTA